MRSVRPLLAAFVAIVAAARPCRAEAPEARPRPLRDPALVLAKEGVHSMWLPYTPPRYDAAAKEFVGYFKQGEQTFRARSRSGSNGTWADRKAVTGGAGSIVKRGAGFFAFGHAWRPDDGWYHHSALRSADGVTFARTDAPAVRAGEACTLLYREEQKDFFCYVRPKPPHGPNKGVRTIGLMTSPDFKTWSAVAVVLAPNDRDHPATQFYSLSVVYDAKRGTYWGFLNVFQVKHDDGPPFPPMTGEDNAVRVQLCASRDGRRWERCYGQRDLIGPPAGVYEQFAVASAREADGPVDVYVLQSKNRHNVPGKDFSTVVRYTIGFDELARYRR